MTVLAREPARRDPPGAGASPAVLLHGPVYDATSAVAAREANPPGQVATSPPGQTDKIQVGDSCAFSAKRRACTVVMETLQGG